MPAFITHMLISRRVREELGKLNSYDYLGDILKKYPNYMDLGSLGPDLPYYESMVRAGVNLLFDRSDKPMGVDQWSYQLHSKSPNIFPLKMIEIAWREAEPDPEKEWEDDDQQKFAFICGFLTHVAADQIIHPLVNEIAGPYYKGGDQREKHRACEVYQDVVIYRQENGGASLMDAKPNTWCDLNPGWGANTEVWFRYFIQKAFVEAHAVAPTEGNIEDWVDGTLFVLRGLNNFGPYVKAERNFVQNGPSGPTYDEFFGNRYPSYFDTAINLALIYVKTVFSLYYIDHHLGEEERNFFLEVVQDADLSAPLEKDIFKKAKERFDQGPKSLIAAAVAQPIKP